MNRFGIALGKLMENHLTDILFNESTNGDYIHLYRAGDCWVAFERSAFNLCRIYSKSVVNAMKVFIAPFPIVLASVEDREISRQGTCISVRLRTFLHYVRIWRTFREETRREQCRGKFRCDQYRQDGGFRDRPDLCWRC